MARIYLDARACSNPATGVGRYGFGLIPALVSRAAHHEFIIIGPVETASLAVSANSRHASAPGLNAVPLLLSVPSVRRIFSRWGTPDLYHALFHLIPFGIRRRPPVPKGIVITLHDLIWIDYARQVETNAVAAAWRRRLASTAIPHALRTADHVICNSEATAQSASEWVSADRRTVVHLGIGDEFFQPEEDSRVYPWSARMRATPCIAALGVSKAYKNIGCLVRAFAQLRSRWPDLRLVLMGGDGGAADDIGRTGVADAVDIMRGVADTEMRAVVRHAKVFVVPSIVEGFGLPVLEAMALGTPVVISDTPALVEVAGDAALRFEASNASGLAAELSRLLSDRSLADTMIARGRARAMPFRWPRAATQTLDVYERVLTLTGAPTTERSC